MPTYTLRRAFPDDPDRVDDFVFRADGVDRGRCYKTILASSRVGWLWTVYGTSKRGIADTLGEAKQQWRAAFEVE